MKTALAEEQFVTDAKGNRVAVMLGLRRYERLLEAEEELADIRAFDEAWPKAQAELKSGKAISLEDYMAKRNGKRK
jgi:hypothetical protein